MKNQLQYQERREHPTRSYGPGPLCVAKEREVRERDLREKIVGVGP